MEQDKIDIVLKSAYKQLGLITFPEDRLAIMEFNQQQDYIDNRDKYVYELTLLLMSHGYTDIPDDRTPMPREEVATKLMEELSRMFHHLANEDEEVLQTRTFNPFPLIRIQVNMSDKIAYLMLGNSKSYNDGDIENFSMLDGDHFLWGLVYG